MYKHSFKARIPVALTLAGALCAGVCPTAALANAIQVIGQDQGQQSQQQVNQEQQGTAYLDANGSEQTAASCTPLADAVAAGQLDGGWYALDEGELFSDHDIKVSGDTNIIMGTGKLTLSNAKIDVQEGAILHIYVMPGCADSAELFATSDPHAASRALIHNKGTVELVGCTLRGDTGMAVRNDSGSTFTMHSGKLEGFTEADVYLDKDATVQLYGGNISSVFSRGNVHVQGAPVVGNIILDGPDAAIVCDGPFSEGASVGVARYGTGVFTRGYDQQNPHTDPETFFHADERDTIQPTEDFQEAEYVDHAISYAQEHGVTKRVYAEDAVDLTGLSKAPTLTDGIYYVTADKEFDDRLNVQGRAMIILCNNAKLTAEGGIHCPAGNEISIYSQKGTRGKLVADADVSKNVIEDKFPGCAGIGGNPGEAAGSIIICDCDTTVTSAVRAAGIGGGNNGAGGNVTLRNAKVKSTAIAGGGPCGTAIGRGPHGRDGGTIRFIDDLKVTAEVSTLLGDETQTAEPSKRESFCQHHRTVTIEPDGNAQ